MTKVFNKIDVGIDEEGNLKMSDGKTWSDFPGSHSTIEIVRVPISFDTPGLTEGFGIPVADFQVGDILLGALSGVSVSEPWDAENSLLYLFEEGATPGDVVDSYDLTSSDEDGQWGGSSLLAVLSNGLTSDESQVSRYIGRCDVAFTMRAKTDNGNESTEGSGLIILAIDRAS